jgi:hypothetical protein
MTASLSVRQPLCVCVCVGGWVCVRVCVFNGYWQIEVRIMIPFTMCCTTCKEFSYRGKKFNSKKEIAQDITYLGLHIHRLC